MFYSYRFVYDFKKNNCFIDLVVKKPKVREVESRELIKTVKIVGIVIGVTFGIFLTLKKKQV